MEDKTTNIKERILLIAEKKGLSKEKFFEDLGLTYGNFKGKSKSTPINSNALADISTKYSDIDLKWLLTGEGEMIKPTLEHVDHSSNVNTFKEKQKSFDKTPIKGETKSEYLLRTDNRRQEQLVPLYNIEASAGLVQLFGRDQATPIDYISIPNLPTCDGAIYVTGDSMYPLLKSGDIVMYKQVLDIYSSLFWGEMYIVHIDIDGDAFTTVKYIHKSEQGVDYIKLVSQNQHHAPKDVNLKHIKAAALVKASIRINSMI